MVINQQNINDLFSGYNVCFNKAYEETTTNYNSIAMTVPSKTREATYAWMGQVPNMREWVGEREIQNLITHGYTIKNRTYELTMAIPVNDIPQL